MKVVAFWLVLVLPAMLGACNTTKGFGEDITAAGRALSGAAESVIGREPATAAAPAPAAGQGSSATPRSLSPAPRAPEQPEEPK